MITTWDIKQKLREVFTVGRDNPRETVLIVGSCRTVPYLNYLQRWNESAGQPWRIHFIEPFNYHWNERDEPVDIHAALSALETDARILEILRTATIFIHEHYGSYGMFNTDREEEKNIYQFGLSPRMDISIPNFHDHFILLNDFLEIGGADDYVYRGWEAVEKFCSLCALTSFPEMGDYFRDNWQSQRFFWKPNHVSSVFTLFIFRQMNERFLHLPLDAAFWRESEKEDMFSDPCTAVRAEDIANYRLTWKP